MIELPSPGERDHCLHVALGATVCAVPITVIVGVRLFGEVELRSVGGQAAEDDGPLDQHVLLSERRRYAAWDLHALLGVPGAACSSWLLLQVANGARRVPIALRAGKCLAVEPVGAVLGLPAAAFHARSRAPFGVFDARHLPSPGGGGVGLSCDPSLLFSERQLDESLRRIERFGRPA